MIKTEFLKKLKWELVEVNHLNRLKSAYSRNKEKGIVDYILWVNYNNQKVNYILKNQELQKVDEGIIDIAMKGANNFWRNLIAFLISFITIFKPNEKEVKV